MVNLMRRYQHALLTIVTIFIIISFTWFFTDYRRTGGGRQDTVGHIYNRAVHLPELERGMRRAQLIRGLGMNELFQGLAGNARTEREFQSNFVFNTYVLRHEADHMGLKPTDADVIEEIKRMPVFQSNGQFDPNVYNRVVQNIGSMGFDGSTIEEVVADSLRFQKLNALFVSTITASPAAVREMFEKRNQKTEVAVVRLNRDDVAKTVQISDEDLKKAFEERKDGLKSDEQRKIRYAALLLTEDDKKLVGADRATAFQKLMEKASEFSVAMTEKDAKFDEVAKKFNAEIKETAEFTLANPPAELAQARDLIETVFTKLTLEQPNSDAIGTPAGYYIAQLTGVTPARPLTFDEAKPKLAETLKNERVTEALGLKGTELRTKLETELKAGKTFAEAAHAAGVTVETVPAFSLMDPPKPEVKDGQQIAQASVDLAVGQLSEVVPTATGSLIVRVENRQPIDEAAFEKEKAKLSEQLVEFQAMSAFPIWLAERRKAANAESKLEG